MKLGIVGLDTSHVVVFTELLNDSGHEFHVPGARVTMAYPGGSAAFSLSRNRVQGYTDDLRKRFGVVMCDDLALLARAVDGILLESVDGRQHLEQFRQVAVGKPVFIDKPFATSTADAREIIALARATKTPIMSSSSLRYAAGIADIVSPGESVVACESFGPAAVLDDYPGLFWYGIHSAEVLFTFLGSGCRSVRCVSYKQMDVVSGEWADGQVGVMRGTRLEKYEFGCMVHTSSGARFGVSAAKPPSYYGLLQKVTPFLKTGVSPIPIEETFAIMAFLEAADKSKALGGAEVALATW
jgi:hypothetical protein